MSTRKIINKLHKKTKCIEYNKIDDIEVTSPLIIDKSNPNKPLIKLDESNITGGTLEEKDTLKTVTERGNITNRDIVFNENGSINLGSSSNKGNLWFSNSYKKDVDTNNSDVVNNVYIGYSNHNPNTLKEKHSINFGNYNSTNLEKSINNISIGYAVNYKNIQNFNSVNIGHCSSFNTKSSAFVTSIGAYSSYGISANTMTKSDLVDVSPIIGNYHHLLNEGSVWLREQTDNWNYSKFVPTNFCSTFIGSFNRGLGPNVTRSCFSIHLGTRILTDFQYRDYNNIIIGNELLKNYGGIRQIHNSLIIGNFIKTNNLNNDLLIHNSKDSYTNESDVLIRGNFDTRYLKINGKFIINPNYHNAEGDITFSEQVVAKPDGTLGLINRTTNYIERVDTNFSTKTIEEVSVPESEVPEEYKSLRNGTYSRMKRNLIITYKLVLDKQSFNPDTFKVKSLKYINDIEDLTITENNISVVSFRYFSNPNETNNVWAFLTIEVNALAFGNEKIELGLNYLQTEFSFGVISAYDIAPTVNSIFGTNYIFKEIYESLPE